MKDFLTVPRFCQSKTKEEKQEWVLIPLMSTTSFFNIYTEHIMQNARLDEAQSGIKIAGRNNNNLRYADDTTLMAESEKELKSLLTKVKEGVKKLA